MMVRDQTCYAFRPPRACSSRGTRSATMCRGGRLAGFLHFVEDIDRPADEVRYGRAGVLWMAAGPGRARRGDVVAVLMNDYDDALAAG